MAYTTIDDPTIHFNTKLYTGNGGSQTITGVNFKPDWTWWKSRDAGNSHALVDIVRGTNKVLYSDSTSTEQPISAQTFNSDGYAIVQDAGANSINSNGSTKVGWSWLAGNGTNSWQMWDNKRPGYNLTDKYLQPNTTSAEISGNNQIDILSTGIKLRSSNTANNGNGQSFIYMAFAESPFVSSSGVPTTAR